jgi:lipoic acid synthetase
MAFENQNLNNRILRKPDWLKIRLAKGDDYGKVKEIVRAYGLHTICESGDCPNLGECWSRGTATFMILGDICTRACRFCAVTTGKPLPPDNDEPARLAETISQMKLKHAVITSVDRDDLPDFGASFWANTIRQVKQRNPELTIEVLVPDFQENTDYVRLVAESKPNIISHNLETVRRLTPQIRSKAKYDASLHVLQAIAQTGVVAKTGIMLGLGETPEEIEQTMDDALAAGCSIFTLGQYLQPTRSNIAVNEYITPETFARYKTIGLAKGFKFVESGPLVRSSYHAENQL